MTRRDGQVDSQLAMGYFKDTGCEFSAQCQACPLPACRYEMPPGVARTELLVQRIIPLAVAGQSATEIAATVGRSRRSIYRIARAHGIRISGGKRVAA